jgi:hypothetical protein
MPIVGDPPATINQSGTVTLPTISKVANRYVRFATRQFGRFMAHRGRWRSAVCRLPAIWRGTSREC